MYPRTSKTDPNRSEQVKLKKKIAKTPSIMTIEVRCLNVSIPGGSINIKTKFETKAVALRIIRIQREGFILKTFSYETGSGSKRPIAKATATQIPFKKDTVLYSLF